MRTNIVIDDQLMDEALKLSAIRTKREVVDEALRLYVKRLRRLKILALQGKVNWEGNLSEMRAI
ncbi:MAG: type II toxin-antitoxin system VapB family antitoxin [Bacteroidota bacterium]